MSDCKPLISIITVVLNDVHNIERTLLSALDQSYACKEIIVIDGASVDGTLALIEAYRDRIDKVVSEPDSGIYDAMNKGVCLSQGDWVIFMNSGDVFYGTKSIENVLCNCEPNSDVIICKTAVNYGSFVKIKPDTHLKKLWKGMNFCHQSVLVRTSFLLHRSFDVKLAIAADFKFFLGLFLEGKARFHTSDCILSLVSIGGVSDVKRLETVLSWQHVATSYLPTKLVKTYYLLLILRTMLNSVLKSLLPKSLVQALIKLL